MVEGPEIKIYKTQFGIQTRLHLDSSHLQKPNAYLIKYQDKYLNTLLNTNSQHI